MLVRMAFGAQIGQLVWFREHEARAMLADGRATSPDAPDSVPVVAAQVAARVDRAMPPTKARRTR